MNRARIPRLLLGVLVGSVAAVVGFVSQARAGNDVVPLFYAGVIEEDGALLDDGNVPVGLKLFTAPTAGTKVCDVSPVLSTVVRGQFRLDVAECAPALAANADLFAEVSVRNRAFPRMKLGAVPFVVDSQRVAAAVGPMRAELDAAGTGGLLVASASINSNGLINHSDGGFVSSVTYVDPGRYTLNFVPGTFSSKPSCVPTAVSVGAGFSAEAAPDGASADSFAFIVFATSNDSLSNIDFNVVCVGNR